MSGIITLPQALAQHAHETGRFYLHPYATGQSSQKNKILLKQNMINFLLSGEKIFYYAGKRTAFDHTYFALLSSGNCITTERLPEKGQFNSILFFFDNSALSDFFMKYATVIEKLAVPKTAQPFALLKKDEFILNYVHSLSLIAESGAANAAMLQVKFEELMLHLLDKDPAALFSFGGLQKKDESDFVIRKAVEENITSNLTMEELAFLCNTSASTFKRRFVKLYGCAPSQYFLQRRMEMASALLLNNAHPGEVFFKVGYENHSSFSQSFKQVYGISPKHYQQHVSDQQQVLADRP